MKQAAKNDGTKRQRFKRRKRRREREKASEREKEMRRYTHRFYAIIDRQRTVRQAVRQSGRQAGEAGEACQADGQSGVIVKQCSEDGTSIAGVK